MRGLTSVSRRQLLELRFSLNLSLLSAPSQGPALWVTHKCNLLVSGLWMIPLFCLFFEGQTGHRKNNRVSLQNPFLLLNQFQVHQQHCLVSNCWPKIHPSLVFVWFSESPCLMLNWSQQFKAIRPDNHERFMITWIASNDSKTGALETIWAMVWIEVSRICYVSYWCAFHGVRHTFHVARNE